MNVILYDEQCEQKQNNKKTENMNNKNNVQEDVAGQQAEGRSIE